MKNIYRFLIALSLIASVFYAGTFGNTTYAEEKSNEIMFLLDASSSMLINDDGSGARIDKAKAALSSTLDTISPDTKVGLRVYGSQIPDTDKVNGCQDSVTIAKPAINNTQLLKTAVNSLEAKGWTLMGKSLQDIQTDFSGTGAKAVILISDGIDTCTPPDACEVAKQLTGNGSKIKVNTVGLLVSDEARNQLSCIADNSGGNYYDINNIDRLQETLTALTKREVTLFTTSGIPIEGTIKSEDAPFMLANTSYTDTLIVPEELYYGYDALPEQKVTINIKAINPDRRFSATDYLRVGGYNLDTKQTLSATGIIGSSKRFSRTSDTIEFNYVVDTRKQKLDTPSRLGFKVYLSTTEEKYNGSPIQLEMKITTEGGKPINHTKGESNAISNADSKKAAIPAVIAGLAALIALFAVVILLILRKRGVVKK